MIHLNASDERGIDIIRNQIHQFVNSNSLFHNGIKFVILDEVDYMTKNAQQALKYLLQGFNNNVRFCLICNYISRIDESLQNEFMRIRFNQLPETDIIHFLSTISKKEGLAIPNEKLISIKRLFKSDIRSMINYIQSNKNILLEVCVLNIKVWIELTDLLKERNNHTKVIQFLEDISESYNMDMKNIIKDYLNYLIRERPEYICKEVLDFMETIMHLKEVNIEYLKNYTALALNKLLGGITSC